MNKIDKAKAKALGLATDMRGMKNPAVAVLELIKPDEKLVRPETPGAQRLVWVDNGQVKITARLFTRFGTVIVIIILVGFAAVVSWLLQRHAPYLWQYIAMGLAGGFVVPFAALSAYNHIVGAVRAPAAVVSDLSGPPAEAVTLPSGAETPKDDD